MRLSYLVRWLLHLFFKNAPVAQLLPPAALGTVSALAGILAESRA